MDWSPNPSMKVRAIPIAAMCRVYPVTTKDMRIAASSIDLDQISAIGAAVWLKQAIAETLSGLRLTLCGHVCL
jgi:hypothetical protein